MSPAQTLSAQTLDAQTLDAVLWSLAAALLVLALWIHSRGERPWDPAVYFAGLLGAFWGGRVPLQGGPVPPEGWDADPAELGESYEPSRRLAPEMDWTALKAWSPDVEAAVRRRLADVRLVWLGPAATDVPAVESREVAPGEGAGERIAALCDRPDVRLILAGSGDDAVLRLLHAAPHLRDRVRAVLLVGARLDPAWISACFTHVAFDVELAHEVPYLTLRHAGADPLPDPPEPPSARRSIAAIDLGVIDPADLRDARCGRALSALFAALG